MIRELQLLHVSSTHIRTGAKHTVEGRSLEELRAAAQRLLADRGYRVRSLSFTPEGLLAYVAADE